MNSAYFDSFDLIASSTRICSVSFFGGFGGDFSIAMGRLLFCTRSLIKRAGTFVCSDSAPRKTLTRSSCEGGSDPTKILGGSSTKKWGRSRPILRPRRQHSQQGAQ